MKFDNETGNHEHLQVNIIMIRTSCMLIATSEFFKVHIRIFSLHYLCLLLEISAQVNDEAHRIFNGIVIMMQIKLRLVCFRRSQIQQFSKN